MPVITAKNDTPVCTKTYNSLLSVDPEAMMRTPYGPEPVFGDQDFGHTWHCYIQLQPFFERANKLGHDVVFALHGDV